MGEDGEIVAADRRLRTPWRVPAGARGGAEPGELVVAEPLPRRGFGPRPMRITERLGQFDGVRSLNEIVIRSLELAREFPPAALTEAAEAGPVERAGREDLRALPLVTIDGDDAKDFDDAVFAVPEAQGFRIIVAIADVAHYVRGGSWLDRSALERGNSVYLPNCVLPMLPEALSEGWCSLRPGAERGCVFAEIAVDAEGRKLRHRFGRGVMKSAARLTYEEVQHAIEHGDALGLPGGAIAHLYAGWGALKRERARRGPLEIDLLERKVACDATGRVVDVTRARRLPSHQLVEDFMILANVAAAEEMLARKLPGLYRVHARPTVEKLAGLRSFLGEVGARLPASAAIRAADLTAALAALAGSPTADAACEKVLQSLPEAAYAAENGGHFGLALAAYAHFTSPIRRYADLLVHRALISTLPAEQGGARNTFLRSLGEVAIHLGITERRAAEAERGVLARAQAALQAGRIGSIGEGRISGVTRSLIFVKLQESGADGVVPVSTLPRDSWHYDQARGSLTGARSGQCLAAGGRVRVRLVAACAVSGRVVFRLEDGSGRARRGGG
ncbi:MAG: ribonuclease R family protein [Acetobacteraceae bacterium]